MRRIASLTVALTALAAGPASANMCKAGPLSCATAMPMGGYCECTSRGDTQSGEVVAGSMSRRPTNSTAGGCGAHPNAARLPLRLTIPQGSACTRKGTVVPFTPGSRCPEDDRPLVGFGATS